MEFTKAVLNGKKVLPELTELGGYPLIYVTEKNAVLCNECATKSLDEIAVYDVYWEGDSIECDGGCGTFLESAYGPLEEDE